MGSQGLRLQPIEVVYLDRFKTILGLFDFTSSVGRGIISFISTSIRIRMGTLHV